MYFKYYIKVENVIYFKTIKQIIDQNFNYCYFKFYPNVLFIIYIYQAMIIVLFIITTLTIIVKTINTIINIKVIIFFTKHLKNSKLTLNYYYLYN